MSDMGTKTYVLGKKTFCCYCNKELILQYATDKNGDYLGDYYKCNCEKAKLESIMNDKIIDLNILINNIKKQYEPLLTYDKSRISIDKFLYELKALTERYGIDL